MAGPAASLLSERGIDQLLALLSVVTPADGVGVVDLPHLQPFEQRPDIRVVVDADDHPALQLAGPVPQCFVLLPAELHTVAFRLPVRRIDIENRTSAVIL